MVMSCVGELHKRVALMFNGDKVHIKFTNLRTARTLKWINEDGELRRTIHTYALQLFYAHSISTIYSFMTPSGHHLSSVACLILASVTKKSVLMACICRFQISVRTALCSCSPVPIS